MFEETVLYPWKPKRQNKYKSIVKRWKLFYIQQDENIYLTPTCESNYKFLLQLHKDGCLYSRLARPSLCCKHSRIKIPL